MKKVLKDFIDNHLINERLEKEIVHNLFRLDYQSDKKYSRRALDEIATKLLRDGECVIAGAKEPMWDGFVATKIQVVEAEGFVDCYLHKLDPEFYESEKFEYFMEYFVSIFRNKKENTAKKLAEAEEEHYSAENLLNVIEESFEAFLVSKSD